MIRSTLSTGSKGLSDILSGMSHTTQKTQNVQLAGGTVHTLPDDFRAVLATHSDLAEKWHSFTPLARNEWICWITEAKQAKTRERRLVVAQDKMRSGMRRPCCWIGCIHRTDKAISPSVQGILAKRAKRTV